MATSFAYDVKRCRRRNESWEILHSTGKLDVSALEWVYIIIGQSFLEKGPITYWSMSVISPVPPPRAKTKIPRKPKLVRRYPNPRHMHHADQFQGKGQVHGGKLCMCKKIAITRDPVVQFIFARQQEELSPHCIGGSRCHGNTHWLCASVRAIDNFLPSLHLLVH